MECQAACPLCVSVCPVCVALPLPLSRAQARNKQQRNKVPRPNRCGYSSNGAKEAQVEARGGVEEKNRRRGGRGEKQEKMFAAASRCTPANA
jgi:hypothetical protein